MKKILVLCGIVLALSGCTDRKAIYYDPQAVFNKAEFQTYMKSCLDGYKDKIVSSDLVYCFINSGNLAKAK